VAGEIIVDDKEIKHVVVNMHFTDDNIDVDDRWVLTLGP
jgi:hypothetical protein